MKVQFLSQPYDDSQNLNDFLKQGSGVLDFNSLTICVAWAKRSGIELVKPELEKFKQRGGNLRIILGISEGGATRQGLFLAHELANDSYVFHDRRSATFHPKIYLFKGKEKSKLFVGSNNWTAGGSYFNYEAATVTSIANAKKDDAKLLSEVEAYFAKLISDSKLCIPRTKSLIKKLVTEQKYRIADEDNSWRNRINSLTKKLGESSEDSDEIINIAKSLEEIFGKSIHSRSPRPNHATRAPGDILRRTLIPDSLKRSKKPTKSNAVIFESWTKKLNASDSQHPPQQGSAVTGNVRLSQAGNGIDHKRYFREIFFGRENWIGIESRNLDYEKCLVEFEMIVNGKSLGLVPLRIDHKAGRIADQNNVPTVLKWGYMGAFMRKKNYEGEWLTLEAYADGSYKLLITREDPRI
jgi:HKD family nuclease